jgi:cell division protein FtsA
MIRRIEVHPKRAALIAKDLFALDLGTTKFCLAFLKGGARGSSSSVEIIGVPAAGMRRGMISDMEQAKQALNTLLECSERQLGIDVRRVVVGIAGSHLQGKVISAAKSLLVGTVHPNDLRDLVNQVESDFQLEERELLHCVPVHYRVDMREPVENPVGFSGRVLNGDFFLIDADKAYLRDVVRLCNQCGLEVSRLVAEPFASASVTVPDERKQLGVVLADIGGGTTDCIVFQKGRPRASFTINVAGSMMTQDLAIGLNLPLDEAERVKILFGLRPKDPTATIDVKDLKRSSRTIGWRDALPIFGPRIQELTVMTARHLQPFKGNLGGGLLLTGGGSEVSGLVDYMEDKLAIPVERVRPAITLPAGEGQAPSGSPVFATKYATVIGLLNLEICHAEERKRGRKFGWSSRYISQFVNWLRDLS